MTTPCETPVKTMVDLLARRRADHQDQVAFVFLDDRAQPVEITYARLEERARAIAARLRASLEPGDRALLVYPPGLEFISAFFGCLYAGVVAVPATYPKPKRPMPRLSRIALDCSARVALSTAPTLTTLDPALLSADAATSEWIATDEVQDGWADQWQPRSVAEDDLAFLQYTSGSTSDPKGVMISHANLLTNLECIRQSFGIGETQEDQATSTGVFWLPAYHDMGLIGGILTPLYMGGRSVLLSPTSFLQRPLRWLEAIDRYDASISGAPNFAYEYCVRRIKPDERRKLDLSHWRLAFCGAEPIRAETLQHFVDAFGEAGFRREAFYPCYGLAETTLLAAGPDFRDEPTVLVVNRAALADNRVVPACGEPAEMTQRLVGCGQAVPDHQIVITDPESNQPCEPGQVGEILIQGPSVAHGYWNQPQETDEMFAARVEGHAGRFLRTGDVGFIRDGELFVTGRLKDIIIIRGRNHYPQDIEQTVEQAHEAVLPGAAFALGGDGDERLVVVHQFDRQYRGTDLDAVVRAIRHDIVDQHELDPHAIVLIRQTSLPITSSGKVQRQLCREQYEADELKIVHRWTNPIASRPAQARQNGRVDVHVGQNGTTWAGPDARTPTGSEPAADAANGHTAHPAHLPDRRPTGAQIDRAAERIEAWLLGWLVDRLGLDPADVQRDRPFAEFGVDSMTAVELSGELEEEFKVPLPPIVAWNYPTPAALSRYLAEEQAGGTKPATGDALHPHLPPEPNEPATVRGPSEEQRLADLLAEIEHLSDEEAARLLGDE